uniref:DYW domain-containing protein n=1 Tax=Kalanchoe fedtschenkoi TaxID=63787 RepID=A0A7N0T0C5_KALFE
MYVKFGNVGYARKVFDEMPVRNEATWNSMVSGYVKVGLYGEAIWFFREILGRGVEASGFVFASLMSACSRAGNLVLEGVQVHGFGLKVGVVNDVFVGTSVLHFYGSYGFGDEASMFFEEMPERNVVSWTSLMVGYSNNEDAREVVNAYQLMRREGVTGNQNTYATVISSCGLMGDEFLGHQVIGQVIKAGLDTNVSVANSLVSMFGSMSELDEACYIFDHMVDRDTISWNSIISAYAQNMNYEEALKCFYRMRHSHHEINSTTISSLLSACMSPDHLNTGRVMHSLVTKHGLDSNICVGNTILTMYSEAGKSKEATQFFQEMRNTDLISWNSMMACYGREGKCMEALEMFSELLRMWRPINHVTFGSALAAFSNPEFLPEGKTIHALAITVGLHENMVVGNALVTMYGNLGFMVEASRVCQSMPNRDVITWNALIGGFSENEESDNAMQAFKSMRVEGVSANYITIVNLLGAFSAPSSLMQHGTPIHAHAIVTGFDADDYVKSSLITIYAKCGDLSSSNFLFDGMEKKSSATWNAMVAANAHSGSGETGLKIFSDMRSSSVNLDHFTFSGGLAAAANLAVLGEGEQLHGLIIKYGYESNIHVINAAMDMYGKCGEMDNVVKLLPNLVNRTRMSWNILISACARHGFFQKAIETFQEMLELGPKPDHVTFVSLLSACSHGGLADEGLKYFSLMTTEFGITPGIEHCVCIIDLLGRSGRLVEAEAFIESFPVQANDLVWRSLLATCKIHNNLELGKKAAKKLLELVPTDDSAYVLYSNVCATTGKWDDVESVRNQMVSKNVKKQPACSWVKLKNKVSSFGMGDLNHPQAKQIYAKLADLKKLIKHAGYTPDTSFALHDTDDEQKEHNLWNHSERLALAFGLINSVEGSTIRIFKNLRVCGDCHTVFKFVSGILKQPIILRDPYRFHHFSKGSCSCSDFW